MSSTNASLKTLTLIFAGLYIVITVGFFLLLVALEVFLGFSFDSSAMGVIVPAISATQAGTIYFNRTGQRPLRGFAWKAGLSFALTSVLIGLAFLIAMYLAGFFPELDALGGKSAVAGILVGFMVVVTLLLTVFCRFSFGFGAKMAQKQQDKKASDKVKRFE